MSTPSSVRSFIFFSVKTPSTVSPKCFCPANQSSTIFFHRRLIIFLLQEIYMSLYSISYLHLVIYLAVHGPISGISISFFISSMVSYFQANRVPPSIPSLAGMSPSPLHFINSAKASVSCLMRIILHRLYLRGRFSSSTKN